MKSCNKKPVQGLGINDADYVVHKYDLSYTTAAGVKRKKLAWVCPFYNVWNNMFFRCYSQKSHDKRKGYIGCSVNEDWFLFSNFKAWMETQDWKGNQLDKDLLVPGNKEYGPSTCLFVSNKVNMFITERRANNGTTPPGVYWDNRAGRFISEAKNPITGKRVWVGSYLDSHEAGEAWLKVKLEMAKLLAAEQTDPRVAKALIDRYENYNKEN